MATQVTMDDGTESPLVDHIRDAHQKGTRGFTEEYLATLHRTLHQRKREPDLEPEHTHPQADLKDEGDTEVAEGQHASAGANGSNGKHHKTRT